MKFFSLFSGVGGFELGMEGHTCIGACEIDEYARETYNRHFDTRLFKDATKLRESEIEAYDCLCAGFPCPDFSYAGNKLGFEGESGRLFYEVVRRAKEDRPSYLFLENVKGLFSHDKGRTFRTVLQALDEVGYDVEWQLINSKYFVPQTRDRIYLIGHLRGKRTRQVFPLGEGYSEFNGTPAKTQDFHSQYSDPITASYYKGWGAGRQLIQVGNIDKKGHNSLWGRVYSDRGIAPTLNAHGGGLGAKTGLFMLSHTKANIKQRFQFRHNTWALDTSGSKMGILDRIKRIRRLIPLECERLQGFPDGWTEGVSDRQRYMQMGNAVTVPVIKYIAKEMKLG